MVLTAYRLPLTAYRLPLTAYRLQKHADLRILLRRLPYDLQLLRAARRHANDTSLSESQKA